MSEMHDKVKELPCALTAEELEQRKIQLPQVIVDHDKAKAEASESARKHREVVDALSEKIRDLAAAINTGKEKRPVPVEERADNATFQILLVRLDTNEPVDSRAMNEEELAAAKQGHLFEGPGDAETPKRGRGRKGKRGEAAAEAGAAPEGEAHDTLPPGAPEAGAEGGDPQHVKCESCGTVSNVAGGREQTHRPDCQTLVAEPCDYCMAEPGQPHLPECKHSPAPSDAAAPEAEGGDPAHDITAPAALLEGAQAEDEPDADGKPKGRRKRGAAAATTTTH